MKSPIDVLSLYAPHNGTLPSLLASRAGARPDTLFLTFQGRRWTWAEFADAVESAARAIAGRGLGRGDRLAVTAANCDRYVILFFALARLGAVLVPVNPGLRPSEARYILEHAEPAAAACAADTIDLLTEAVAGMPRKPWLMLIEGQDDRVPSLEQLLSESPSTAAGDCSHPDDVCLIMYTSGTTGYPKGVMHTQRNFVMAGEGFVERMHLQANDRLLCILPLFHINALFYSLGGAVAAGASLTLAARFSASGFWRLVAESGATEVNIIAAVGTILTHRPRSEFVPGHRLTKVYGAPVTAEIAQVFTREFSVATVIEGYGMTEIPGACNVPFFGPYKAGSMGRPALHPDRRVRFAELRVVDEEGGDLPDGEVGELLVRTPIAMKGYYRDPERTAAAFRDGWFATGDLVLRADDGFFHFVARKKDIIRRRGENVSGAELDRVLGEHPGVAIAAAIGVPCELGEEEILVAVVPRQGAEVGPFEIRDWCAARLSAAKVPRFVLIVDDLPLTPSHRVAKFALKSDKNLLSRAVDLNPVP